MVTSQSPPTLIAFLPSSLSSIALTLNNSFFIISFIASPISPPFTTSSPPQPQLLFHTPHPLISTNFAFIF
ncbi:hypothetical protein MtrunA17_Chr4g0042901 [Medicago truncatula]|uniref:Transmembrane protein n=1 Tax=Medicago truncatula TaxID=3880 RepID=A0A396IB77_MEDTR|nr:hypothetical protein MtrunA17_Chr4g0042901 [Medicago truncatula]